MAKDLENWLGNLYFEVIRMPRCSRVTRSEGHYTNVIVQVFGWDEGIRGGAAVHVCTARVS